MIKCQYCGKEMTEAYVMKQLPTNLIISEGARAMALSQPHSLTRKRAQNAANARWKPRKMAKALGIHDADKMTTAQLHKALDKLFE